MSFSPDGKWLASGAYGGDGRDNLMLWDTKSGALLWRGKHAKEEGAALCFSPDGKSLMSAGFSDKKLRYHDLSGL